jgi:hypothetical protein
LNRSLADAARQRRPLVHFAIDSLVGIPLTVWFRYDLQIAEVNGELIMPIGVAVMLQGVFGLLCGHVGASGATGASKRSGSWR